MSFTHDATGVESEMKFRLLPDKKWFPFKIADIVETKSSKGFPMVKAICEVIDDPEHAGMAIWHYVTFLPKDAQGAGICIHFLKSIGQPHEGVITVKPEDWISKRFMGFVIVDTYNGKPNNKIYKVSPYREGAATQAGEDVPF